MNVAIAAQNAPPLPGESGALRLLAGYLGLLADHDALTAKILRQPERSEILTPVQEQLIVELYSK